MRWPAYLLAYETHDARQIYSSSVSAMTVLRKKVLVVEDLQDARDALGMILEEKGYAVTKAASGIDAIDKLIDDPSITILFTDIGLPNGLSGFQLARAVAEWHPDLRIVLGTGYNLDHVREMAGYDASFPILKKPYELKSLLEALR